MRIKTMKSGLGHNQILAVLLLAPLMAASAYATDYGEISVKVEAVTEAHSSSGYDEYRVRVINRSPAKSHGVPREMRGDCYGAMDSEVARAMPAAPSSAVTVSMFKPVGGGAGAWFVSIDGKRQDEAIEIDASRTSAWISHSQNIFFALSSRDVEKLGLMNDPAVVEGFKSGSGESDVAYLAYKSPISEWGGNWLGYSGFDGGGLTAAGIVKGPEAGSSSLWRLA